MLKKRIISAVLGIIYLILMLYFAGWFFNISILLFSIISMYEFYNAFINKGYKPLQWLGYFFISIFYWLHFNSLDSYAFICFILLFMIGMIVHIFHDSVSFLDVSLTVIGFIYPGAAFLFMWLLLSKIDSYNQFFLILTLFTAFSTDTFAYFIGIKYGSRKLCPKISPKKTIEGSIGGLIGSIIMGVLIGIILRVKFSANVSPYHFVPIGIISGIFSQLGDLSASSIKRFCNIKDFGSLLPGHGGILDRFDSVLFVAPIIYIYYSLFLVS